MKTKYFLETANYFFGLKLFSKVPWVVRQGCRVPNNCHVMSCIGIEIFIDQNLFIGHYSVFEVVIYKVRRHCVKLQSMHLWCIVHLIWYCFSTAITNICSKYTAMTMSMIVISCGYTVNTNNMINGHESFKSITIFITTMFRFYKQQ